MDESEELASIREGAETDWPFRPWLFAGLLAAAGLAIHFLTNDAGDSGPRAAAAAFIAFLAGSFAFTVERERLVGPTIFSVIAGLVVGGLTWRAVGMANDVADGGYALAAGIFASILAVPLFQAGFHRRWFATRYADIHYFVWTDAITGAAAFAFLGLSWLLLFLLSALFDLVGIPLDELIEQAWFGWTFSGLALGAGLGTLRNQLKIIGTLQSVVLLVLSILAVPLALAIVVFLAAVAVSGPGVLWDATDSATPVLLSIAIGAYVLANAVLRDADEDMTGGRALRWAAHVLALAILPLTVFAAISTGLRIDQHGLSPERLWALASIAVAVAFGLAYFLDGVIGFRGGWRDRLRASNLRLAFGTAIFALVLALPIFSFGSISTKDQLARLESGEISVEDFDFAALRWDLGAPGRVALEQLAESEDEAIQEQVRIVQAQEDRPYRGYVDPEDEDREYAFVWQGGNEAQREAIEAYIEGNRFICSENPCFVQATGAELPNELGTHFVLTSPPGGVHHLGVNADGGVTQLRLVRGGFVEQDDFSGTVPEVTEESEIEIRPFEGRQLYVDGEPVGEPFE